MCQCISFNYHADKYLCEMTTLKICTADGIYGKKSPATLLVFFKNKQADAAKRL